MQVWKVYFRYDGANGALRWLLDFDEKPHAYHVSRDVTLHEQPPLSVNSYRNNVTSEAIQQDVKIQGISDPSGTLYLFNQKEFYYDAPLVWCKDL